MAKFSFLVHPLDVRRDVGRKYPFFRWLPEKWAEAFLWRMRPKILGRITGIRSLTGAETEGWLIGVPMTAPMMFADEGRALRVLTEACQIAKDLGAGIIGLGAFTAIIGDGGKALQDRSPIPVTTGNSYTVWTALEALREAAALMGIAWAGAKATVIGATGAIGKACARFLCGALPDPSFFPPVQKVTLVGRDAKKLRAVLKELAPEAKAELATETAIRIALQEADLVITVTSAFHAIIGPEHLKPGCVVCDVARPRDVSRRVREERDDLLVIDGGIVEVPGRPHWDFPIGLPDNLTLGCVAETMILALEDRLEPFTLGRDIQVKQVLEIATLARKHGFRLGGLRSFEGVLTDREIEGIRARAKMAVSP